MRSATGATGAIRRAALPIVTACVLGAVLLGMARSSSVAVAAASPKTLVLYTIPVREMFINNDDDEERGNVNNPFGTREGPGAADDDEESGGPFPGDASLFSFEVYASRGLKANAGSAVFTCQYAFDKNALCNASFHLKGSMLFGAGPLNFDAKRFALVVTGGSGRYAGASGEVRVTPSGKHGQRLVFVLD